MTTKHVEFWLNDEYTIEDSLRDNSKQELFEVLSHELDTLEELIKEQRNILQKYLK